MNSRPSHRPAFGRFSTTLACLTLALAATVASAGTHVKDEAKLFSAQAAERAETQLAELKQKSGRLVVVETMTVPPPEVQQKIVANAAQRNAVLLQLAGERGKTANADVYVLINKTPGNLQVAERRDLQSTGLPAAERKQIQDAMLAAFGRQQFDEGLNAGVSQLSAALGGGGSGAAATPRTPASPSAMPPSSNAPSPRQEPPSDQPAPAGGSMPGVSDRGLLSSGCCVIGGIGLLVIIVVSLVRRMSNRGGPGGPSMMSGGYPNQPGGYPSQGGAPPQYPQQQQGGGFGRGMAGGLLGGVLGSVLGNQMSRGHDGGGHSSNADGGTPSQDTGFVGGGGDFGTQDAGNDSGGSDDYVGGGGDFGGDSGGGDSGGDF